MEKKETIILPGVIIMSDIFQLGLLSLVIMIPFIIVSIFDIIDYKIKNKKK